MLNDPPIKTPAEQQKLTVPPPAASVLQSLQNVVVTTLWSNWVLFEVLEKEIQPQRLLRQQSLFPRPLSTQNNKLQDNCNTTTATVQPCYSSFATFAVPVNDSNKNSDDESTSNSAPTKSAKKVLPSPTHRHQAAGQKPKPSKNRYHTALVSQPEDDDECSSNSAPAETEEIATPLPTHRQPFAGHKTKRFRSKYDMTPSPKHRQQDTSQKPKPSKKRYDATLGSQPEDNAEYISNSTPAKQRKWKRHHQRFAYTLLVKSRSRQRTGTTHLLSRNQHATCRAHQSSTTEMCLTSCGPALQGKPPRPKSLSAHCLARK